MSAGITGRPHGRPKYVVEKCRCATCRAANTAYRAWRNRQNLYGHAAYVDAEPVREHVRRLQAAQVGWKRVADLAGVNTSVVAKLLYGMPGRGRAPSKRVRPETAAKILAVTADPATLIAGHTAIGNTGTVRRLQALVACGWSQAKLAARLGMTPANFGVLMHGESASAARARAVRALFDELWDQAPPENAHRDKISVSRAKRYARERGWLPPQAWDDGGIDDPVYDPTADIDEDQRTDWVVVDRVLDGEAPGRRLTHAERVEVAAELLRRGEGATRISKRLNVNGTNASDLIDEARHLLESTTGDEVNAA